MFLSTDGAHSRGQLGARRAAVLLALLLLAVSLAVGVEARKTKRPSTTTTTRSPLPPTIDLDDEFTLKSTETLDHIKLELKGASAHSQDQDRDEGAAGPAGASSTALGPGQCPRGIFSDLFACVRELFSNFFGGKFVLPRACCKLPILSFVCKPQLRRRQLLARREEATGPKAKDNSRTELTAAQSRACLRANRNILTNLWNCVKTIVGNFFSGTIVFPKVCCKLPIFSFFCQPERRRAAGAGGHQRCFFWPKKPAPPPPPPKKPANRTQLVAGRDEWDW